MKKSEIITLLILLKSDITESTITDWIKQFNEIENQVSHIMEAMNPIYNSD